MKRSLILLILLFVLITPGVYAATAADLITSLRILIGEGTDTASYITDAQALEFLNSGQDMINRIGGYLEKQTDYTIADADTFGVALPSNLRDVTGVMLWDNTQWEAVVESPDFKNKDETALQWDWKFKTADSAFFYLKGNTKFIGQIVRITYKGDATNLDSTSVTVEMPQDLHVFIVQEAGYFYLWSIREFQAATTLRQQIRQDMGIVEAVEKQ